MNTLNTAKVYRSTVTAQDMSIDGWSRDFDVSQTLDEMTAMGVDITREQIELHWSRLSNEFETLVPCDNATCNIQVHKDDSLCDACLTEYCDPMNKPTWLVD